MSGNGTRKLTGPNPSIGQGAAASGGRRDHLGTARTSHSRPGTPKHGTAPEPPRELRAACSVPTSHELNTLHMSPTKQEKGKTCKSPVPWKFWSRSGHVPGDCDIKPPQAHHDMITRITTRKHPCQHKLTNKPNTAHSPSLPPSLPPLSLRPPSHKKRPGESMLFSQVPKHKQAWSEQVGMHMHKCARHSRYTHLHASKLTKHTCGFLSRALSSKMVFTTPNHCF